MATPRARGVMSLTISSLIRMSPDVCRSRPAMILKKVVLPQPDGPSSTKNSPSRTDRLTPSTAVTPPKSFLISLVTTAATGLPPWLEEGTSQPAVRGRQVAVAWPNRDRCFAQRAVLSTRRALRKVHAADHFL